MTQLLKARQGIITQEIKSIAKEEQLSEQEILKLVADGLVVIPANKNHKGVRAVGVGKGLRTKVNANIGTSAEHCNIEEELEKVKVSIEAGADTLMDLSTGGDLDVIREKIISKCEIPVGTVPIYHVAVDVIRKGKMISELNEEIILEIIERHGRQGVDFITIHSGLTMRAVKKMKTEKRFMNVVSRGGSFIVNYIRKNGKENPFYTAFDKILDIAREYDITLSLGDGLRPGCLHDATDSLQIDELLILGELRDRAVDAGVQVMIEGPGHVPLGEIPMNIMLEKKICKGAPFYVLGPLPTDITPGYDHITGAVGGAIAAASGADFLCFLTPSEHLRLPTVEDVREGVIATRVAANIGDLEKKYKPALERNEQMALARERRDWDKMFELAIDPVKARKFRESAPTKNPDVCTMCGDLCSMKLQADADKHEKDLNTEAPTL